LILSGLGFKLAAVPFHFYAPDVYQGASHTNAALLAAAPKIAGILAIIRLLVVGLPLSADLGWQLAMVLAVLTMTLGNVSALWQRSLRRLMAYSSIANAGYLLIGVSVGMWSTARGLAAGGLAATLVHLMVYILGSLGTFAALAVLGDGEEEVDEIDALAGLARSRPLVAGSLAVCLFSLAGIPPLAGFWGKLSLFGSALQVAQAAGNSPVAVWFAVLAVVGALNAAIAAAYYLRVVGVMFFRGTAYSPPRAASAGPMAVMLVCTMLLVGIGISPRQALRASQNAERGLPRLRAAVVVEGTSSPSRLADAGRYRAQND
jgi:NADH-quinone oxidoreductase subunit N